MSVSLDTLYTAETPEGIALALRPAGIVARFYAFLIDIGVRTALLFAAMIVLGILGKFGGALVLIIFFALEWFYPVFFELAVAARAGRRHRLGRPQLAHHRSALGRARAAGRTGDRRGRRAARRDRQPVGRRAVVVGQAMTPLQFESGYRAIWDELDQAVSL